jgi:hypothetical protein
MGNGFRHSQRGLALVQSLREYEVRREGLNRSGLDTPWASKFNGAGADIDLNAAPACSIHEKADSPKASQKSIGT